MTYRLTSTGGVVLNGVFIPNDPANPDWRRYQAWLTGNSPDPVLTQALADAKADAIRKVDLQADRERQAHLPAGTTTPTLDLLRYAEADAAAADGEITAGEYLLLEAEIPEHGANVAAVAAAVQAERTTRVTALAAIEDVRVTAHDAINAAADAAAVQTVLGGIAWP